MPDRRVRDAERQLPVLLSVMTDAIKPSVTVLGPGDPGWRPEDVDPRTEADAQISHAFNIVVEASDVEDDPDRVGGMRAYTPDELESLFFSLGMAMVQLKKLPGGREARDRFYAKALGTLKVRGRPDILEKIDASAELRRVDRALDDLGAPRVAPANAPVSAGQPLSVESRVRWLGSELRRAELASRDAPNEYDEEAVEIVKRTFGGDVDLRPGTVGHHFVRTVALELKDLNALREKFIALAIEIRQD